MSSFLFVTALGICRPSPDAEELRELSSTGLEVRPVLGESVRRAVARVEGRSVFVVTHRGDSGDLVDRGPRRYHCSGKFAAFVEAVSQSCGGVVVVLHWCRGEIESESIVVREEVRLAAAKFVALFPRIEEDVRYVCLRDERPWERTETEGSG